MINIKELLEQMTVDEKIGQPCRSSMGRIYIYLRSIIIYNVMKRGATRSYSFLLLKNITDIFINCKLCDILNEL